MTTPPRRREPGLRGLWIGLCLGAVIGAAIGWSIEPGSDEGGLYIIGKVMRALAGNVIGMIVGAIAGRASGALFGRKDP